ncbi:MAG: hypothetical protein Q4A34_01480 [Candidatus Saccharibacteria bacterium]|nr:hypothetical protein [Candidatus Saccharibacteria bacterium]
MSIKQKPVTDERVIMEDMKYRSEALTIIAVLLGASIVTKEYILKLPLEASTVDVVLLIVALTYPFVRGLIVGGGAATHTTSGGRGRVAGGIIAASVAIALIATFFNYQRYNEKYNGWFDPHLLAVFGVAFTTMLVCNTVVYGLMRLSVRRAQRRIDRQLD